MFFRVAELNLIWIGWCNINYKCFTVWRKDLIRRNKAQQRRVRLKWVRNPRKASKWGLQWMNQWVSLGIAYFGCLQIWEVWRFDFRFEDGNCPFHHHMFWCSSQCNQMNYTFNFSLLYWKLLSIINKSEWSCSLHEGRVHMYLLLNKNKTKAIVVLMLEL